jgi:hypothetical protein
MIGTSSQSRGRHNLRLRAAEYDITVKVYRGRADVEARLADAGWHSRVEPVGDDRLIGDARQAGNR